MKRLFHIFCIFLVAFNAKSSHIVGGEIYYDYLGSNQYRIYINVFRDCLSSGADFDMPLPLGIFTNSNNSLYQSINVPYTGKNYVPVTFNNPCVVPPSNICTENSLYSTVVTLPPSASGYRVAYVRCCRGPSINNLVNPDDTGLTLTVNIPGSANGLYINSSPRFNSYPPMLLCNNEDLLFNHSATDPDGDVLVYSLATPFRGGTPSSPMPTPTPNPPYSPITWSGGHSEIQPLGPNSSISIDPNTGILTASPYYTGKYVVGIRVDEYRGGVLISSTIRDFIFRVFNCTVTLRAILPLETALPTFTGYCSGNLNVQFINNSYGGTNYAWDFGDPTTTTDVSTAFAPSYNYPDTGTYIARMIVNPGWPCTDTAYIEINLHDELITNITNTDSLCLQNNQYDFVATTNRTSDVSYSWNFGNNASPTNAVNDNASTHFTTEGQHRVILTTSHGLCENKDTVHVVVIPQPKADFNVPSNYKCEGLEVTFINNTSNATIHLWDFGVNNETSTVRNPTFEFPAPGTYNVSYYASSTPLCIDSSKLTITVNEELEVSFTQSPNQCIIDNSFDFIGTVSGPPSAVYYYTFHSGTSTPTINGKDALNIEYETTGWHNVTLTGQFENCTKTDTSRVFIYASPTIGFGLQNGLQCAPFIANFINYSTADSPMFFEWNFGDGSTSNETNPSYVYENSGSYPVTLSVKTEDGCIDTLYLTQVDLINIHPKPIADFKVDRNEVDICNSLVSFTNTSVGEEKYLYNFDELNSTSTLENPQYLFSEGGDHFITLIVTSDQGCTDTTMNKVFVEPFSVFIPNSFTPDNNEFNSTFSAEMWLEPSTWELKIFNRWGEMVYESFDYTSKWDGTYNGSYVPSGTYSYLVKYKPCTIENESIEIKGHVTVLR